MVRKEISGEGFGGHWQRLPAVDASDLDWSNFKQRSYEEFIVLIRKIDRDCAGEPYRRLVKLRDLRREHHLIVVADRIRRDGTKAGPLTREALMEAAERIVDRSGRSSAAAARRAEPPTRLEERMLISARVNWSKLLSRAGSRTERRGGWGSKGKTGGTKTVIARLMRQVPDDRAKAFRKHVRDRIEQLVAISDELLSRPDSRLSDEDRLLIRELEFLLGRARAAALQEANSAGEASAHEEPSAHGNSDEKRSAAVKHKGRAAL